MNLPKFLNKQKFEIRLSEIEEYYKTLKSKMDDFQNKLLENIESIERTEIETDEQDESNYDELCEKYQLNESIVKKFFKYSVIIQVYTLIERTLNCICDFLKESNKTQLSYKDLNGQGTRRSLVYLEKLFSILLSENEKRFLNDTNLIRNIIVHVNGDLKDISDEQLKKIKAIFAKKIGIFMGENKNLEISDDYIAYLFTNTKSVFSAIYSKIYEV